MTRTALLAGASGLVGGHALRLLLEEQAYERVTIFVRRELPLRHRKLVQRVVDFDCLAELADCPRVHDVFCCLGTTIRKRARRKRFARWTSRTSPSWPALPHGTARPSSC